ncbi:WXG100 family type VII secretion target [Haloactinospora alba]|uniref:WXG100 family type VII secretion target n=1 Tax=Haloactinospora alba TaxID=405555 RepID=A0A543N6Q4_9ACTN|nr:WXG100 family type VII secretion target [Haloactinospora alba]TQN27506.1 WXG100 family type VII secretion target [Haloactinospora alba]
MAQYKVDSDQTEETSSSLKADFEEFEERLENIKSKVDGLLEDGYATPKAEEKFSPFFKQFQDGFKDVNEGLKGISEYLDAVGKKFQETDDELGKQLG